MVLPITNYADELLNFDGIDWPERVKHAADQLDRQAAKARHVVFHSSEQGDPIEVFTTRPDTLWGATFMVLAPEHPLVDKLTTPDRKTEVEEYVNEATRQTEIERKRRRKRRPACSPARMRSIRSTARAFRSGSPTTC